jgi:hypothetical protein
MVHPGHALPLLQFPLGRDVPRVPALQRPVMLVFCLHSAFY